MIEHALWEGLASGVGSQVSGEAEGLVDRQVSLDDEHRGSWSLSLLKHVSSPPVQDSVDTSNCVLWALNFTTTSVDGVSVESHVVQIETGGTHVLIAQDSLLRSPLESSNNGVLDLVKVLHSLSAVNH